MKKYSQCISYMHILKTQTKSQVGNFLFRENNKEKNKSKVHFSEHL